MGNSPHRGLKRLAYAARYSYSGLRAAWANEEAARIEMVVIALAAPLGFWLGANAVDGLGPEIGLEQPQNRPQH